MYRVDGGSHQVNEAVHDENGSNNCHGWCTDFPYLFVRVVHLRFRWLPSEMRRIKLMPGDTQYGRTFSREVRSGAAAGISVRNPALLHQSAYRAAHHQISCLGIQLECFPNGGECRLEASGTAFITPPRCSSARAHPVRHSGSSQSRGGDSQSRIAETARLRPTPRSGRRLWRRRLRQGVRPRY
jgi:hypothetical protein